MLKVLQRTADKLDRLGLFADANQLDKVLLKLADPMGPYSTEKFWRVDIHNDPFLHNYTLEDTKMYSSEKEADGARKELEEAGFTVRVRPWTFNDGRSEDPVKHDESYLGFEELEDKEDWKKNVEDAELDQHRSILDDTRKPFYDEESSLLGNN